MFFPVQKYKSQYKNKSCSTKLKKKNGKKTTTTTVQQCVSQYRNIYFSTKIKISAQKNIFLKIWKKPVGTLYMIIVMYLNIYVYPSPTTVIIT